MPLINPERPLVLLRSVQTERAGAQTQRPPVAGSQDRDHHRNILREPSGAQNPAGHPGGLGGENLQTGPLLRQKRTIHRNQRIRRRLRQNIQTVVSLLCGVLQTLQAVHFTAEESPEGEAAAVDRPGDPEEIQRVELEV